MLLVLRLSCSSAVVSLPPSRTPASGAADGQGPMAPPASGAAVFEPDHLWYQQQEHDHEDRGQQRRQGGARQGELGLEA